MGLFKREPIYLTGLLIAVLAVAEGGLAWRYGRGAGAAREARIARLERELRAKQAEIDHLIFQHDSEQRLAQATARRARAAALAQGTAPGAGAKVARAARTADEMPLPSLEESDLAQATAQALSSLRRDSRHEEADRDADPRDAMMPAALRGVPSYPVMSRSLTPDADGGDDVLASPQGASPRGADSADAADGENAELGPSDIEPKNLVNMANLATGKPVAELTRIRGRSVIRYKNTDPREDDPVWHLLDSIGQAHALHEVLLTGRTEADARRLGRLSDTLVASGVPARLVHVKIGDADYKGLEGMLISLEGRTP